MVHEPADDEAALQGKSASRGPHRGSHGNSASAYLFSSNSGLLIGLAVVPARIVSDGVEG